MTSLPRWRKEAMSAARFASHSARGAPASAIRAEPVFTTMRLERARVSAVIAAGIHARAGYGEGEEKQRAAPRRLRSPAAEHSMNI